MLLLRVAPAYQRHQHQSEYIHFGFSQSQTEELQLEIPSLLSPQPIEGPKLRPQSNFWTLRDGAIEREILHCKLVGPRAKKLRCPILQGFEQD